MGSKLRRDGSRCHGIDADAFVGHCQRHHPRELVDAALADVVAGDAWNRQGGIDRAHVDDAARTGFCHFARHGLRHQKRTLEVDAQHGVKVFLGDGQKIASLENPGVVHQHINAPMGCHGRGHHGLDLRLVAHVAMQVQAAKLSGQGRAAGVIKVSHHDLGAFACEAPAAGFANALRAARDQANAAGQAKGNQGSAGGVRCRIIHA